MIVEKLYILFTIVKCHKKTEFWCREYQRCVDIFDRLKSCKYKELLSFQLMCGKRQQTPSVDRIDKNLIRTIETTI